ncbi:MAG: hypothetical protein A3C36_01465 [Omnitrophica WOR_2 bacterium RIFCSPHIGHO2_02_FULL_52_10]|nr:MAG: hypothetical protein A3C36_01465 [Omnitrophica WOR_2 bacterium RIFCSPHIGHO2_02_FULL_52_10]
MARKKNTNTARFVIKSILIVLVAGAMYFAGGRLVKAFKTAAFFKVQSIVIDPSLQFIRKEDLRGLFGKNIFSVDLRSVQTQLSRRYPQASQLKLVKRFPNQILIVAKKRLPVAQMKVKGNTVTLDEEGVILSVNGGQTETLPGITGISAETARVVAGLPLDAPHVHTALKVIKLFGEDAGLSDYAIAEVDISNLSKIFFMLTNRVQVIIDRDNMAHNIKVLGVILSQKDFDVKGAQYIDLRFKEPIIGKK